MENTIKRIDSLKPEFCTGCGTCFQSCPVNAIDMEYNEEGFLFPVINSKCVNCGLCAKVCPQIKSSINTNDVVKAYAAWGELKFREKGSSGGIFACLAEHVIEEKGFVFGASFNEGCGQLRHICVSNKDDLNKIYKSKY